MCEAGPVENVGMHMVGVGESADWLEYVLVVGKAYWLWQVGAEELAGQELGSTELKAVKDVGVVVEAGVGCHGWGSDELVQELSHSPCH